ncbi:MAG: biotin/lipoyl-containing protein [Bacteroidota bacterium]
MKQDTSFRMNVDNGRQQFSFNSDELPELDLIQIGTNQYHLIDGQQSVIATLRESDLRNKRFELSIDGNIYIVDLADQYDLLVEKMGLSTESLTKVSDVKAPMPGLVLNIKVSPGQEVAAGDVLIILEAMKMENVLKAAGEGVVASVEVDEGQAVDKGQVLIHFE